MTNLGRGLWRWMRESGTCGLGKCDSVIYAPVLFHSSISLGESSSHSRNKNERNVLFFGKRFPVMNISVDLSKDKAQALNSHQENGVQYPWLPMKYTTLFIDPILYSELSQYNRQADISSRIMEAGTCQVLLISPFWAPPSPHVTTSQFHTSQSPHCL